LGYEIFKIIRMKYLKLYESNNFKILRDLTTHVYNFLNYFYNDLKIDNWNDKYSKIDILQETITQILISEDEKIIRIYLKVDKDIIKILSKKFIIEDEATFNSAALINVEIKNIKKFIFDLNSLTLSDDVKLYKDAKKFGL